MKSIINKKKQNHVKIYTELLEEAKQDRTYWEKELAGAKPNTHKHGLAMVKLALINKQIAEYETSLTIIEIILTIIE